MTKKYGLIILGLSLITHFAFFGYPAETVFDEVHFGKFVSGYFTGEYYFDIHPPLGKLIIAGMAKISGFQPGFSFQNIGQDFPDNSYKWFRFLPSLTGALLPLVVFLIALESGINQRFAFLAGLLIIFENSLLAQSRFILLDSFLLLFGFLSILFFLKSGAINYKRSFEINSLFWAGVFASLAASVKWTGLGFLAVIGIFYLVNLLKSEQKIKLFLKGAVFLIVVPFLIYFSTFAIHFSLLSKPGPGDAFHPANFRQMNVFQKFTTLNAELYTSNKRLGASHPYTSEWYQWPFMNKPIFYWDGSASSAPGGSAKIYFIGNPLIWWLSTLAAIYSVVLIFKNKLRNLRFGHWFLVVGFLINWLPFIFIGRVMFLYHYFASLIFAILILALTLDISKFKNEKLIFNSLVVSLVILFLFFSPLTYGFAIPEWYYKITIWLPSWR